MIFGKKIKELREEHGLLQRQLSAALEIDTPMYSKIERGERNISLKNIIEIAAEKLSEKPNLGGARSFCSDLSDSELSVLGCNDILLQLDIVNLQRRKNAGSLLCARTVPAWLGGHRYIAFKQEIRTQAAYAVRACACNDRRYHLSAKYMKPACCSRRSADPLNWSYPCYIYDARILRRRT